MKATEIEKGSISMNGCYSSWTPTSKTIKASGATQMVKHQPSKHEAKFKNQYYQKKKKKKIPSQARCQWLMPIILATWEAEITRFMVPGHPRQIVPKTPGPK
jgi:hypothetical protein